MYRSFCLSTLSKCCFLKVHRSAPFFPIPSSMVLRFICNVALNLPQSTFHLDFLIYPYWFSHAVKFTLCGAQFCRFWQIHQVMCPPALHQQTLLSFPYFLCAAPVAPFSSLHPQATADLSPICMCIFLYFACLSSKYFCLLRGLCLATFFLFRRNDSSDECYQ